jgi:hypothetical protein
MVEDEARIWRECVGITETIVAVGFPKRATTLRRDENTSQTA